MGATETFRLTTGGVRPDTQIHTHMCYAEFGDILQAIDDLDADVISLEGERRGRPDDQDAGATRGLTQAGCSGTRA
ncbi:hypothetical protein [Streptomyces sp. NPDC023838]|uniref:hypothetical protein n=1 Tax=Streptomyces sp. NPDC023838 TaxID=3154325 RepID=UPI0033ED3DF5